MKIHAATAGIFDMDGLLLDTEILYTEVTQEIVGRFGKVFDWSIKANMIGRPAADSAKYLVETLDLPITPDQYRQERESKLREKCPSCRAYPGAQTLIRELSNAGIPIALATSSHKDLYQLKTQQHQSWFSLFNIIVTGDDSEIQNGKPAPDIFLLAAKRLGIDPKGALVFEDSPSGLEAGVAAGMRVICIPDANMDKSRYQKAELVLDSISQFNPGKYFRM